MHTVLRRLLRDRVIERESPRRLPGALRQAAPAAGKDEGLRARFSLFLVGWPYPSASSLRDREDKEVAVLRGDE